MFTFGQAPVLDAAMAVHKIQFDAVTAIIELRPFDKAGLDKSFDQLAIAIRTGLTGVPDAMKEGLKGSEIVHSECGA